MFSTKESLRQMSMRDEENYLKKLSEDNRFSFFKNIFLVYSLEDGYAPKNSSKIIMDSENSITGKMAVNFWKRVKVRLNLRMLLPIT